MVMRDYYSYETVIGDKIECEKCKKVIEDDTKHIACE